MKIKMQSLLSLTLLAAIGTNLAVAGDQSYTFSQTYKDECASCHIAYPPGLLSSASWRSVMAGLDRHFGSDASLDAAKAAEISRFLEANSARKQKYESVDGKGQPVLRITEGSWFQREHRDGSHGITSGVWKLASVKSPANCAACHQGAEKGIYSEREIRIPRS